MLIVRDYFNKNRTYLSRLSVPPVTQMAVVPCGCQNGGTCVTDVHFPAGSGKHLCVCPEGKQGDLCDQDVDECRSAPCAAGNCIATAGGYRCECPAGLKGEMLVNHMFEEDQLMIVETSYRVFGRCRMPGRCQRV